MRREDRLHQTPIKLFVMDGFEPSASAYRELFRCLLPLYPVSDLPLSYTTKWSRVLESNQSPPFCRGVIATSYVTRHINWCSRRDLNPQTSSLATKHSTIELLLHKSWSQMRESNPLTMLMRHLSEPLELPAI